MIRKYFANLLSSITTSSKKAYNYTLNTMDKVYNIMLADVCEKIYHYHLPIALFLVVIIFSFDISNLMKEDLKNIKSSELETVQVKKDKITSKPSKTPETIEEEGNTEEVFKLLGAIYSFQHSSTWIDNFSLSSKRGSVSFEIFGIEPEAILKYINHLFKEVDYKYDIASYNIKDKKESLGKKIYQSDKDKMKIINEFIKKKPKNEIQNISSPMFDPLLLKNLYHSKITIDLKKEEGKK